MSRFRERLREAEPQRRIALLLLALGLAALLGYLVLAPKPWNAGVAAELRRGSDVDVGDYAITWLWWTALVNSLFVAAALATNRRWLHLGPAPARSELAPPARRPSLAWALLFAGALATGAALALPRLSQSLWADEAFSVMRSVDGYWRKADDGTLEFRSASWVDTLWWYRMPNNHVPHSILARLSLDAWQSTGIEGGRRLGESALRLPAFLAGIGSIGAAAWLLWRAGFPAAGIALAWLLALHPWHLRYASEARGHSLLLFLTSAHLALLLAVLHRGSWPRWLGYGATQLLMLWTYPAIALELVVANLAALLGLVHLHRGDPALRGQLLRWATVTAGGAMLWMQLIAPHVPQLLAYMEGDLRYGDVGGRWTRHFGSYLFLGMPWKLPAGLEALYPRLVDPELGAVPGPIVAGALVALALVATGVVRLWRGAFAHRVLALVLLLPGPLTWLAAWAFGVFLRHWYLLFALPAWGALLTLGATWPLAARGRAVRAGAIAGGLGLAVAYAVASHPAREALRSRSLQPRRESVAHTRPSLDPLADSQQGVITASFSVLPSLYDPHALDVATPEELHELMRRADREGVPLYVNVGGILVSRRPRPGMIELVQREDLFVEDAVFPGFEPMGTRHVYRYRGSGDR